MTLEKRSVPVELRSDGKTKLSGYAAVFGQETNFAGQREVIRAGAFADTLRAGGDVLALADHDPAKVLGRTKSGTLTLREDSHGLAFELRTPNTSRGRDLLEMATRGDLGGMSFGFHVTDDEYLEDVREIRAVDLFEISIVSAFPAYSGTTVEARTKLSTRPALAAVQRRLRILTGECL